MNIFEKLLASFDTYNKGFSAKKLSAFASVITSIVVTFKFGSTEHIEIMLTIWLGFALLCLGIISVQQIINFKNGTNQTVTETKEEKSSTFVTVETTDKQV